MKYIDGGVCAPIGFKAAGIHCGVKSKNTQRKDVALIVSECECTTAAVYTKNIVKAAPLLVTKQHLGNGVARAVIANSGNANASAPNAEKNARRMCEAAAKALDIPLDDVIVASTGVIGQELNISVIEDGIPALAAALSTNGSAAATEAIMTTDTVKKEYAVEWDIGGKTVRIGAIAKGSGMIHPNMGTLLCFITTDAAISQKMLQKALALAVKVSFNRVSVDGDTSTNDMCSIMASGMAGNPEITAENADYAAFAAALSGLCVKLARSIAADGEGAKHLITCTVRGARNEGSAEIIGKSVISSSLVKAAVFGADANWGRVLCAMGYSGEDFAPDKVSITFSSGAGTTPVCENGRGLPFDEDLAKKILMEPEVMIEIHMGEGSAECTCWGCDLTYDYVKINGDYRT